MMVKLISIPSYILFISSSWTSLVVVLGKKVIHNHEGGPKYFYNLAMNATYPDISDKVGYKKGENPGEHAYQEMYGQFLLPKLRSIREENRGIRFFEIGLGCDHDLHRKKKGVFIWHSLFTDSRDRIWEVDISQACVDHMIAAGGIPKGITPLVGDQGNVDDLSKLITTTGGNFDVIIDDGGHKNTQIFTSFNALWPHLSAGGLYFIEDLDSCRTGVFEDTSGGAIMADILKDWIEQLIDARGPFKHPIPTGVKWIVCIHQACVLAKCENNDVAWCSG